MLHPYISIYYSIVSENIFCNFVFKIIGIWVTHLITTGYYLSVTHSYLGIFQRKGIYMFLKIFVNSKLYNEIDMLDFYEL